MLNPHNNLRLSLACTTLLYGLMGIIVIFQASQTTGFASLFIVVPFLLPLIGLVDLVIAGIKKRKISVGLQKASLTLSILLIYAGYTVYMIFVQSTSTNIGLGMLIPMLLAITISVLGPLILFTISIWLDSTLKNDKKTGPIPE